MFRLKGTQYTCPVCRNLFTGPSKPLSTSILRRRTDFKPITSHGDISGGIVFCGYCGFAGAHEDFSSVTQSVASSVRQKLAGKAKYITSESEKYENAALCAQWQNKSPLQIGELWLYASWHASEDSPKAKDYRNEAIKYFNICLNECIIPSNKRAEYAYLIGELFRRNNDMKSAQMWFNRVEEETEDNTGNRFVMLSKQQLNDPKEYIEN